MPKLKPTGYQSRNLEFQATLADHMVRHGLNKGDVAEILRLQRCAARKYVADPSLLTVGQLRRVIEKLNFTKDEVLQLFF